MVTKDKNKSYLLSDFLCHMHVHVNSQDLAGVHLNTSLS